MDIDFLVQDTYSLTRPQWKLATDLEEATERFSDVIAQNYKPQDSERPAEADEDDAESSSSDDDLEEDAMPEVDEEESSDEAEASAPNVEQNDDSESEEEIFVTRQEEERDPEAEAEFDREFEKMMSESMESRKFERKGVFDIPLPMKRSAREGAASENLPPSEPVQPPPTMAFSLMTKKGNKQQVGCPTPSLQVRFCR